MDYYQNNWNQTNQSQNSYNDPAGRSINGFAIASLIIGIASIILCCFGIFSLPLGSLGILFAILSRRKGKGMPGMSIGGICTSIIGMIFGILVLIYFIFIAVLVENPDSWYLLDPLYQQTYGMDFEEFMEYYGYPLE